MKQVAVIGDGSLSDEHLVNYAVQLGAVIAQCGYHLVCGGLGGVMTHTCRGFKQADCCGTTIGILPSHQFVDANEYIDIVIPSGLDVGRNQLVVASGFAVVAFGGGAGTLSEIALASQLGKPIILVKGSGGWSDYLEDDFLDKRQNVRIYHLNSLDDLPQLLTDLAKQPDSAGAINSGHNR